MELMQHTILHQLTQALEQSRTESQLQYATWIRQGETKGLRGLFRNLKASELSWQRPYRHIPVADRVRHRLRDWRKHWQPPEDHPTMDRPSLKAAALAHAAQLPPITIEQLARTLKKLPDSPDRACGPDAIQEMEATATLPTQLQMSLVVMLAKNERVERPMTLTSVLY